MMYLIEMPQSRLCFQFRSSVVYRTQMHEASKHVCYFLEYFYTKCSYVCESLLKTLFWDG